MLIAYWFKTDTGLGYGVTAESEQVARDLLMERGYPLEGQRILDVVVGVSHAIIDPRHVAPNAGPTIVRGVWFPRHNL